MKKTIKNNGLMRRLLMTGAVLGLLSLWVIGMNRTADLRIADITIDIDQIEGERSLISEKDVMRLITEDLPNDITFQRITDIDISTIEGMLNSDTRILNAEVFIDAHQKLNVEIIQRRPILRVMNQQGDQFYVDQSGSYVRTVNQKATRVPVVTGYVESLDAHGHVAFAPRLERAYQVITEARKDPVLKALIEQVHVEKKNRITIIPKIGDERIILDHMDSLKDKLSNLKQFYRELARTNSWEKYNQIDISYNDQVVVENSDNP